MNTIKEDIKYLKYTLFHPFDAFYEIKWREKGNKLIATVLLILYAVCVILQAQYNGFIGNKTNNFNSIYVAVVTIFPYILLILSNWSVATLYNGKGKVRDLYIVTCYSLVPMIITGFATIFLSNIITLEEFSLVTTFRAMGVVWTYYLIFCGFTTVHEYTVKESVLTFIATAIAAVVIMFICVLYLSLMEQFVGFVVTLIQEIINRG